MSEIEMEVLHNIGNILNSINVNLELMTGKNSSVDALCKASDLLINNDRFSKFLTTDEKISQLFEYCVKIANILKCEINEKKIEAEKLKTDLQIIKDIVENQLSFTKNHFPLEEVFLEDIVEKALSLQTGTPLYHQVDIIRKFFPTPSVLVHKLKLLNVIINLIKNAKEAVYESNNDLKQVTIEIHKTHNGQPCLTISDNGIGMTQETLSKIFTYGFTTKYYGHGFGLHSCVSAIRSMDSEIIVTSEGLNKGSQFSLIFPTRV